MGGLLVGLVLMAFGVWIIVKKINFTAFYVIPIPYWLQGGFILLLAIFMLVSHIF